MVDSKGGKESSDDGNSTGGKESRQVETVQVVKT